MLLKLKSTYETAAEIAEELKPFYVEGDGEFHLHPALAAEQTEIRAQRKEIDKFREENVRMLKQNKDLESNIGTLSERLAPFEGIDPDEARNRARIADELAFAEMMKGGREAEAKELVTKPLRRVYEKRLNEATRRARELEQQAAVTSKEIAQCCAEKEAQIFDALLGSTVTREALALGARPEGMEDLANRIRQKFRLNKELQLEALDADGDPIYSAETQQPLTVKQFLIQESRTAAHLFHPNQGSGAGSGSGGSGTGTVANPFKRGGQFNLTRQAQMMKNDPGMAEILRQQSGN